MSHDDYDDDEVPARTQGYARESGYSRRARLRRRRQLIILGVVGLALFFAFWYALSYYRSAKDTPTPRASCSTPTAGVRADSVQLNVYNATTRNGLASSVSKSLASRGFRIAKVENDPEKKVVKRAVELRYGPDGRTAAQAVARHLTDIHYVQDKRQGATVDVVLGNAWKALGPIPAAPTPVCVTPTK